MQVSELIAYLKQRPLTDEVIVETSTDYFGVTGVRTVIEADETVLVTDDMDDD